MLLGAINKVYGFLFMSVLVIEELRWYNVVGSFAQFKAKKYFREPELYRRNL
jgi:hypothetical protein